MLCTQRSGICNQAPELANGFCVNGLSEQVVSRDRFQIVLHFALHVAHFMLCLLSPGGCRRQSLLPSWLPSQRRSLNTSWMMWQRMLWVCTTHRCDGVTCNGVVLRGVLQWWHSARCTKLLCMDVTYLTPYWTLIFTCAMSHAAKRCHQDSPHHIFTLEKYWMIAVYNCWS